MQLYPDIAETESAPAARDRGQKLPQHVLMSFSTDRLMRKIESSAMLDLSLRPLGDKPLQHEPFPLAW